MACTVARMACTALTQMAPCSCCNCKSETANETAIAGPRLTNADEIREFQELVLNKRAAQLQRYVLRQPVLKNTILDNLVLGMENGIPHWGYTMNCPNLLCLRKDALFIEFEWRPRQLGMGILSVRIGASRACCGEKWTSQWKRDVFHHDFSDDKTVKRD